MAEPQPPAAAGEAAGDGAAGSAAAAAAEEGAGGGGEEDGFIDAGDVAYTPYRPAKVRIGKPHPDPVVENTSLAAVPPPDVTYESHLPPSSLEQLSEVQMESVIYAGQQFSKPHLKNGERAGFMIGDGAGVGKGRQLAGIIMDAWMQGHKRHVWFSISPDLLHDTKRDLKDIKPGRKNRPKVYNLSDLDYDENLTVGDGVIFSTYKSLTLYNKSKTGGGNVARLGQLERWLGGRDAEGCIVFDEAHKAKNLYLASKATVTGKKVKEIQDLCPAARVVYCSATPCSEPMNMGYMTRLGLWGDGTRFDDFPDFLKDIDARGVGAMELVAMQLKAEGMLLSRSLSFQGCDFSLVPLVNSKYQIDSYNAAVKAWQLLWQVLNDAVEEESLYTLIPPEEEKEKGRAAAAANIVKLAQALLGVQGERSLEDDEDPSESNGGKTGKIGDVGGIEIKPMKFGMMKSMYWAAHQRFFRAMCIAFKVDKAVEITNKALEDDMCVVIGLQSTGESNMRDAVKRKDPDVAENKFLSSPGEIIKRFIIKVFWADEADDISDDDEWSLEPSKKRAKTEDKDDGLLGWKAPKPLARGGAPTEAEELEQPPDDEESKAGDDDDAATVAVGGIQAPPLVPASAQQIVDVEEIDVDEEEGVAAGGDGGGSGGGGSGSGSGGDGGGGGVETASSDRIIPSFTEEEDNLLWGQGETKFEQAKSRLHAWLDRLHYMVLPQPPLDQLVNRLGGPNAVAEMTGRQDRMVKADDGKVYLEKRDANNTAGIDEQNNFERAEFNEGRKLVAIISDAASAGVSLHANRTRPENPRRRLHITMELPWSADKAIQQLGRTHRANQFQPPIYQLIVSEVCGETRFSAAVAKRLESLGALTQGDRRASHAGAGELGFTSFNVDNQYGKMSLDHIYRLCISSGEKPVVQPPDLADDECAHIRDEVIESRKENERYHNDYTNLSETSGNKRGRRLQKMRQLEDGEVTFFEAVLVWLGKVGIVVEDHETEGRIHQSVQGNVSRFLNRILGLRIVRQHVLFDYFHSVLEYHVKEAKRDGTFEDGIRSLTGASCSVSVMRALDLPEETGLAKGEVEAVKVTIDKSMTFQQILPKYLFAKEETKRRIDLAKRMQAERVAAGNKVNQRPIFSKTGFYTRLSGTQVFLVVDYPGRVTSGYSTHGVKNPMTVWSPCRGRLEISYKRFVNSRFVPSTEAEASHLWDMEMIRDKQDTDVFVLRGSRLLMAWPHLDRAFNFLFKPPPETKKKDKTARSPVVHVKAAAPSDPLEEAYAAAAAETLKEFNASDSEEDGGTALVSQEDAGKSFIALQLPTTRPINENMANDIFNILERGIASNLRYDVGPLSRPG